MNWKSTVAALTILACGAYLVSQVQVDTTLRNSSSPLEAGSPPALGAVLALPAHDTFGVPLDRKPSLVILLGGCTSCSAKGLPDFSSVLRNRQVVLIVQSSRSEILSDDRIRGLSKMARICADPSGELGYGLNSSWIPRWYEVDKDFRLVAFQATPTDRFEVER